MKNRTTIYIDEDLKRHLQKFAIDHDVSTSKLISDVLITFLGNEKQIANSEDKYPIGGYWGL